MHSSIGVVGENYLRNLPNETRLGMNASQYQNGDANRGIPTKPVSVSRSSSRQSIRRSYMDSDTIQQNNSLHSNFFKTYQI